jgi:hypothetical protein
VQQQESFDHQDSALHAYYAQAHVQHAGCVEERWEENLTSQLKKNEKRRGGRGGRSGQVQSQSKDPKQREKKLSASKRGETKSTVA